MSKFNWKTGFVYFVVACLAVFTAWHEFIITNYGEYVDPFTRTDVLVIILVPAVFIWMLTTFVIRDIEKPIGHFFAIVLTILVWCLYYGMYTTFPIAEARNTAKSYNCPITWEGSKATLACEYGKVELTVSTIPLAYHMRPLPNKGICKYKKYATGKFEDCKIFNEISSH